MIQLPAGTLDLSTTIYLGTSWLILRGTGEDPSVGTVLQFVPDENTKYDVLTEPGEDNVSATLSTLLGIAGMFLTI